MLPSSSSSSPPPSPSSNHALLQSDSSTRHQDLSAITPTRRPTAIYPNVSSANKRNMPFSRSAAKRESVMALGSIEHLQHYFTKTGLAKRPQNPTMTNGVLVPALGPGVADLPIPMSSGVPTLNFELPPPPATPSPPRFPYPQIPRPTYQVDPEMLKPEVIQDLQMVEKAWNLTSHHPHATPSSPPNPDTSGPLSPSSTEKFDVLSVLKTTTRAIRSVRNYLVALPDDHPSHTHRSEILASFRRTIPRPSPLVHKSSNPNLITATKPVPPPPSRPPDPLALIRRSALDVLTVLRDLEEASRLPVSEDPFDEMSMGSPRQGEDALSVSDLSSRSHTPAGTLVDEPGPLTPGRGGFRVSGGRSGVTIWSDSENDDDGGSMSDAENRREPWDDRLVLGGGWLYKTDIDPATLTKEREAVGKYLDVVDDVLFGGAREGDGGRERGWERVRAESLAKIKARGRMSMGGRTGSGQARISRSPSPFKFPRTPREDPMAGAESPESVGGRRVVSAGFLDAMRDAANELDESREGMSGGESGGLDMLDEEDEGLPDDELPDWARRDKFAGNSLGRLHELLVAHLPANLIPLLPPLPSSVTSAEAADFRQALLTRLYDGQLLCTAYNVVVRRSRKPWGFIQPGSIHDIVELESAAAAEEEGAKKGKSSSWTFRRTENLRLWAAALKLRYLILSVTTSGNSAGLASPRKGKRLMDPSVTPPLYFDPKIIAKRDQGWETMLENATLRWVEVVVEEARNG